MGRAVNRSAGTGRFVSARTAARSPKTTVRQSVPSKGTGYRSASTGRYVTKGTADRHPNNTIAEGGK